MEQNRNRDIQLVHTLAATSTRAAGTIGWSAQNPRAAFFAFLAARFSFRLADAAFLLFSPPLSFDAIRGLLTDCGQPGRAALIVYRRRQHRQQRR